MKEKKKDSVGSLDNISDIWVKIIWCIRKLLGAHLLHKLSFTCTNLPVIVDMFMDIFIYNNNICVSALLLSPQEKNYFRSQCGRYHSIVVMSCVWSQTAWISNPTMSFTVWPWARYPFCVLSFHICNIWIIISYSEYYDNWRS